MSDTPRLDAVRISNYGQSIESLCEELERELAAAKNWINTVAPRYEALALEHLDKSPEDWPEAVTGCRTILEECPTNRDEWEPF